MIGNVFKQAALAVERACTVTECHGWKGFKIFTCFDWK